MKKEKEKSVEKEEIIDIDIINEEESEEDKYSGGKLVINDSLNTVGKWESKNYTSMSDGIYMGFINHGDQKITMKEGKKDPYVFDFEFAPGYVAIKRTTISVVVKNRKGYIDCSHLARICDYLKISIESKEKEIKSLEKIVEKYAASSEVWVKSRKDLLTELKERLLLQEKTYEALSKKRTDLLKEVQREYDNLLISQEEMEKILEERKNSYDKETIKCFGKLNPTQKEMKDKHVSVNLNIAEKLLKEGRKTMALINHRIPNYEDMLEILGGKSIKRKSKRISDDD
jgi:hypothetical protein